METPQKTSHIHIVAGATGLLLVSGLLLALFHFYAAPAVEITHMAAADCGSTCPSVMPDVPPMVQRQAARLQARLQHAGLPTPSVHILANALIKRSAMLKHSVTVHTSDTKSIADDADWKVALARYPWLMTLDVSAGSARFDINEESIAQYITTGMFEGSHPVNDVVLTGTALKQKAIRADVSGIAKPGFVYAADKIADQISDKLSDTESGELLISAEYRLPTVEVRDGNEVQTLTLLSQGRSNFSNSPMEREWNVHMALEEKVNNTVVYKGEVYSFNGILDTPVTLEKGWKEAMGLFGGGAALTPGAGICQAATTVYRAALLAGLTIVERANHSLYVDHYEEHGVGVDATVFPGVHDLRFRNNTPGMILVQSYTEGDEAYVNIYGINDGRKVEMEGPYFVNTRPRPAELRPLGFTEIGWVQRVTMADGTKTSKALIAYYSKPIAYHRLSKTYLPQIMSDSLHEAVVHAAAPKAATGAIISQ